MRQQILKILALVMAVFLCHCKPELQVSKLAVSKTPELDLIRELCATKPNKILNRTLYIHTGDKTEKREQKNICRRKLGAKKKSRKAAFGLRSEVVDARVDPKIADSYAAVKELERVFETDYAGVAEVDSDTGEVIAEFSTPTDENADPTIYVSTESESTNLGSLQPDTQIQSTITSVDLSDGADNTQGVGSTNDSLGDTQSDGVITGVQSMEAFFDNGIPDSGSSEDGISFDGGIPDSGSSEDGNSFDNGNPNGGASEDGISFDGGIPNGGNSEDGISFDGGIPDVGASDSFSDSSSFDSASAYSDSPPISSQAGESYSSGESFALTQ